jgi:hypothetical protein
MSRIGMLFPILALKSPQMKVVSWGWRVSSKFSTWVVACVSVMLRLLSDVDGGMYTFTMFMRLLLGKIIFVCRPYSLPFDYSIYSGVRIYVASPPLVLFGRRCSISLNPSNMGAAVSSEIHVSCRHKISKFSCSRMSSSLM